MNVDKSGANAARHVPSSTTPRTTVRVHRQLRWTVVGFFADTRQPFVEHVAATNAKEAVVVCIGMDLPRGNDQRVYVEVFAGHHAGALGNPELLND